MSYVISIIIGYLLGSINASIIISKMKGTDIRKMGSGNAGATNTLRSLGAGAAAIAVVTDIFKGVIAVLLAKWIFHSQGAQLLAGAGAILGHNFPLYFGFRGGKGVLTSLATALVIQLWAGLIALAVGIIIIILFKYVSLGSMSGAVVLPIATAFLCNGNTAVLAFMTAVALLVILRHHKNIERLIEGKERKLSVKKRAERKD